MPQMLHYAWKNIKNNAIQCVNELKREKSPDHYKPLWEFFKVPVI